VAGDRVRPAVGAELPDPWPATPEEEEALVRRFVSGLQKLFSAENNWTFLQPLLLTMEHCARCQTCSASCHVYEASGGE
jgi:heterodisulfide reductase subunit C